MKNDFAALIAVAVSPLTTYGSAWKHFFHTEPVAARIRSYSERPLEVVNLLFAASVLSAIAVALTGYNGSTVQLVNFPMVDELLEVLMFILGGLLSAVVYHPPLRWFGGIGRFRHSAIACAYRFCHRGAVLRARSGSLLATEWATLGSDGFVWDYLRVGDPAGRDTPTSAQKTGYVLIGASVGVGIAAALIVVLVLIIGG